MLVQRCREDRGTKRKEKESKESLIEAEREKIEALKN